MAPPRLSNPPLDACTSRRAAARAGVALAASLAAAWVGGCAGLLGIEEATCDPEFDPSCAGRSVGTLSPMAGRGGQAPMAGSGGNGSGGNGSGGSTSAAPAGSGGAGVGGGAAGSALAGGGGDLTGAGGDLTGAGGALAGAGGTGATVEVPLCDRYCNTIAAGCTGENEQYASLMACRSVCALLDPGEPGEVNTNTVQCRLARAELAQATGEPSIYCHTAGPGGGGLCGTDCEGFCALMAQKCSLMGSYEECLPLCDEVPDLSDEENPLTYATSIQSGDTVQCRLYHVSAATIDPMQHCSHAAGVALCVPPAGAF